MSQPGDPRSDQEPTPALSSASSRPKRERRLAKAFRWQAFFQRAADALFVLDRRRRLLFVNTAWETLTGMTAAQVHDLAGRRPRPATADDTPEEILSHALTPPPEVLDGAAGRVRRLLPGRGWWEVEFLPLLQEGEQGGYLLLGRIRAVSVVEAAGAAPLPERLVNLRRRHIERYSLAPWTSSLPSVRRLVEQVRLAAAVTAPVLLVGESGSGKRTLARTIHYLGPRREAACAVLDCEHVPPAAVAAVLFGEGGQPRPAAVYLREPASLPRDVQQRLVEQIARAATEKTSAPRILAGCVSSPELLVREGRLLEELACALATLVVETVPLRQRRADLPALVERLLERLGTGREARVTSLSADAWAIVRGYAWPGNLRELHDVLRDAGTRAAGGQIRAADLPAELRRALEREQAPPRPPEPALPLEQLLEEAERRLIQLALRRARGRKALAARLLSIPRPRLWRRMLKLGIADPEGGPDSADEADDEG